MKYIYIIASVIILFVVSFSLPFNVNESNAQAPPQCNDGIDNEAVGDGLIDFGAGPGFDPECSSLIDDDESVLGGDTYISFQDPLGTLVNITRCGSPLISQKCADRDGETTGCAAGWSCPANDTTAACHIGISGTVMGACAMWAGVNCATPYEACNCVCGGVVPPVVVVSCIAGNADADSDGDNCDYSLGENMFNCPDDCLPGGIPKKSIEDVLGSAIDWILGFAVAISIVMLIWGGLSYVGSAGDTEKATTAKKVVSYALIGLLVAGASYAIIKMIDFIIS